MKDKGTGGKIKKKAPDASKITKSMTIGEAVERYPESVQAMMDAGLHCIGCHVAAWESIEDGARGHGLSDEDIDRMVEEMNKVAGRKK